jgi:hypothetical protein
MSIDKYIHKPAWAGRGQEGACRARWRGLGAVLRPPGHHPEGSYLSCCQPTSERSEAEKAAGRYCCWIAACAGGAGSAWTCALSSLRLQRAVERKVSSEIE